MAAPVHNPKDLIRRGERKPTRAGTLTFVGLRLLDLPLQHALLSKSTSLGVSLLTSLGVTPVTTTTAPLKTAFLTTGAPLLDSLSVSGAVLLLLMATGSSVKQIYWQTRISYESFPAGAAAAVSLYNSVFNSTNALLFLALATTSLRSRPVVPVPVPFGGSLAVPASVLVGTVLYAAGMAVETVAEVQRRRFKSRPENEGKVCREGLWAWARHVNYFGYALWRGGYSMVACGWVGGIVMGLLQGWDLSQRAVGVLDEYCSKRYKEQWTQFKREVPYKIIPGIY